MTLAEIYSYTEGLAEFLRHEKELSLDKRADVCGEWMMWDYISRNLKTQFFFNTHKQDKNTNISQLTINQIKNKWTLVSSPTSAV